MGGDLNLFQTIVIAIVEGLTEFLPVSSTGHMIIAQHVLGVKSTPFVKAFTFIIQFGAILSVVCLYWKRFFKLNHAPAPENASALRRFLHRYDFYWKLFVAFIPAAVLGLCSVMPSMQCWRASRSWQSCSLWAAFSCCFVTKYSPKGVKIRN